MRRNNWCQSKAGERGLIWLFEECEYLTAHFERSDLIMRKDRHCFAVDVAGVADAMDVSKTTAYRSVRWLVDQGFLELADVTDWRGNSKKHWYAVTGSALSEYISSGGNRV